MSIQIRVADNGRFRESFVADAGGPGGWYKDGIVAFGTAWGWADVSITALTNTGEFTPLYGKPAEPARIENNSSVSIQVPDGTRHVTVEGTVEHPPTPDDLGTRPWAAWLAQAV